MMMMMVWMMTTTTITFTYSGGILITFTKNNFKLRHLRSGLGSDDDNDDDDDDDFNTFLKCHHSNS